LTLGARDTKKTGQARKRRPKPLTVDALNRVLSGLILQLEDALRADTGLEPDELCRVSHALSQASVSFLKTLEAAETAQRVSALEQALEALRRKGEV
jgi:hypothetical protein